MGQFKPMVKMFTDEPSVILKLKKGGGVKAAGQAEGFKSMSESCGSSPFEAAEDGKAPKKPSMAERRKAMNPNQYAKGGKVAHKQMGGAMPMVGAPTAVQPAVPVAPSALGRAALTNMAPAQRMARAAMVRKALGGMKKGGSTAKIAALEKELHHHEALSASKAHGKASGGAIDKAETRTTIEGNAGKFAKTKMDTAKKDKAHGTGEVKEGKPAGYAKGGSIPSETTRGKFVTTEMHQAKPDRAHGTGGIKVSNAGGFKKGGKVPGLTSATIEGGNWENRAANTAKPGVKDTSTGEVKEANAGGYCGGGRAKKAYATGGNVISDGKAEKMPRHFVSRPVANSLQSGTFKKGGKVKRFAEGSSVRDLPKDFDPEAVARKASAGVEEAMNPLSMFKELYQKGRDYFRGDADKAPGAVTKTKESVTVAPGKKRGGKC